MIQERDLTSGQKSRYFYLPYEFTAGICQHSSPNARNKQFTVSAGHYSDTICLFTSRCSNQFLSSHFFNEIQIHREETWITAWASSVSSWAQIPGEPQAELPRAPTEGSRLNHALGSPWGSSCTLNFRRLKEAQGKGIHQSQDSDHLTTFKSFK